MRLGVNWLDTGTESAIEAALPVIDELNAGAVATPSAVADWSLADCEAYAAMLREHGLEPGEIGYWENLLVDDTSERERRIERVRALLRRAEAMDAACVVCLVGSRAEGAGQPHPGNYTEAFREDVRETVREVLDGLELDSTKFVLEPWYNTFFHRPEPVRDFLDSVDDDRLGVHMDAMNMHTVENAHRSREVVDTAFELLADDAAAVHVKDLALVEGEGRDVCTLREIPPGEGGCLDMERYVKRITELDDDVPVYTEHWESDETYESALEHVGELANRVGAPVVGRR